MAIKSFLDLEAYQESLQLAQEINKLLKSFPSDEKYLLVDQMKRASRGIPSLIAESLGKKETTKRIQEVFKGRDW